MDSLSQIVLGASVAAVIAPAAHRRKALLMGAALGTLPDLDVLIRYGDAVRDMTFHRGFSHSIFVLTGFALSLWGLLRWRWAPVRAEPMRWGLAIGLTLITHPLLDSLTVYGTQLFWPMTTPPIMGGSVFIIDPLYTLPLLVAVCVASWRGADASSTRALRIGLSLSTAYLLWGLIAQQWVDRIARDSLAGTPHQDAPRLVVASPFNTMLWRVVVLTPEGYLEGQRSVIADHGPMHFESHAFDRGLLRDAGELWAVQRLLWFSHGFQRADVRDIDGREVLVLSDLRMGQHPDFFFAHRVAVREEGRWVGADNSQLPRPPVRDGQLAALWQRMWNDPTP